MIGKSTYIRSFTKQQRKQLELVSEQQKLNTVPDILFYTLEMYLDQQKEIERLKRIIDYKQAKIERISNS